MFTSQGLNILKDLCTRLPASAGVYRMLNEQGRVLYVGKARNLRNRVTQYTQLDRLPNRLRRMVSETRSLDVVETSSEAEALMLEANLIKSLQPRYNIKLKDDSSYPFILLTGGDWPQVKLHRGQTEKAKGELIFGPYPSPHAVRQTIDLIERLFKLRSCSDGFFAARKRPCLKYDIGRCTAPCVGKVTPEAYAQQVEEARLFLKGQGGEVQQLLKDKMAEAAAAQQYEKAGVYRDRLTALSKVLTSLKAAFIDGLHDADMVGLAMQGGRACVQLFMYRGGQHVGNGKFFPTDTEEASPEEVMQQFLMQYYLRHTPPAEVLCSVEPKELSLVCDALDVQAGRRVKLSVPQRGEKAELMRQVVENAQNALQRKHAHDAATQEQLEQLQKLLNLPEPIQRVEMFDISNIQGKHAVASLVVAGPEGMMKDQYRKFAIKEKDTPDDYGMMREVLTRRYGKLQREGQPMPDVVMVDGGKGQLGVLVEVFNALNISGVALCGVAKGEFRDKGLETIWSAHCVEPLPIPFNTPLIFLLQRIRDESHRFAITYHRAKRAKGMLASSLDTIPGVGPAKKKALLQHFGSVEAIKNAGVQDMIKVAGISKTIAEAVYKFFH
jgi:excinuclease ABC subunit C